MFTKAWAVPLGLAATATSSAPIIASAKPLPTTWLFSNCHFLRNNIYRIIKKPKEQENIDISDSLMYIVEFRQFSFGLHIPSSLYHIKTRLYPLIVLYKNQMGPFPISSALMSQIDTSLRYSDLNN
jgi:hypothetical protein